METGEPGLASAPVHINSVAAQTEKRMDIHAPLMAVYIPTVPALPAQHYPPPPAPAGEAATVHLAVPPLYSMETLPFLTLHIAGGLQSQSGLSLAGVSSFSARPKSAGKHMCHHCGRDCMKPSVLEKHLRCHTGERPYPCTTCGISFKTQSNLYKHKRTQAHARLSSESDQSCAGSLDSLCSSSLSLEESNNTEKATSVPSAEITPSARMSKICSPKTHFSQQKLNSSDQESREPKENETIVGEEQSMRNEKHLLNAGRHLPLQRQEATLFSKQWDNSASRGKSQSHESTDSGFSESSDLQTSPGSALPDHGGDSLTESNKVDPETANTQTPSEPCQVGQEPKHTARDPEQKSLVERISKLISENTAVVEDKQLETVRPRKSVLSKQGSIDLPMPYTYKDSFHFDMRINKTQNFGLQRNRKAGHYSSVPTQQSTSVEPAPLIRSSSLPFSAPLLPSERSNPTSSHQSDYLSLVRRRSSGQIKPTGFAIKSTIPVNTHHPLIRQIAVDCNHATDGPYRNSSVEERCSASSSCDRESADICGEPSNRKLRRKKAEKFAYNKWYMYGGGSFKKLYSTEKGDEGVKKGRKSSTNLDREVVQGLHKRFPDVHKETLAGSGPAGNLTCSKAITCHPVCPPAKLSHVSAQAFYPKIVHLPTSCSSLRRNLSSSALPLPLIASLVNLKTDSQGRAEDGRLINEEKHTDSSLQLLESHIPSDRKKQKTDKKIIYPLEMETDPSAMTHPPPSVTGSYINLPSRLKHHQLTGVLLPPCVISANIPTTSISTLSATSAPSAAKTSFLPKYQLKLPNAGESHPKPPPLIVGKTTITDISSALSSPREEPPLPSSTHTHSQLHLPCTATTLRHPETSSLSQNTKSSLAVVHRKFATTTVTTTCRKDYQAGLCSTSVQPSKSAGGFASEQLTTNSAPLLINLPATPTLTTGNSQTSAFSQGQLHPLLPVSQRFTQASSSNTPTAPCHIIPFDHTQPAAQNVFHVQTADLQICLQIISDEQLALMEPQIERQTGSDFSQMHADAGTPEVNLDQPQGSVTTGNNNEDVGSHQSSGHQKEMDRRGSATTPSKERVRPQHSEKAASDLLKAVSASDSESAELPGPPQPAPKRCDVDMGTETQSVPTDVMATAASYKSKESGGIQHVLSLGRSGGEHVITDSRVGQSGSEPQTLSSQHKPSRAGLPTSVVNQGSKRREVQEDELKNQVSTLKADTMTAEGETSAQNSNELESGESHPPPQSGIGQTFSVPSSDEGSGSVASYSISERQFHPRASIHRCDPVETSKHANMASPMNNSSPPLETTPSESHDVFSSAPSQKQPVQFTSVSSNIQAERSEDIPAELSSSPIITAGFMEGHSLSGCAAQKGAQKREHGGTPAPSDCRGWRPVLSREAGTVNHQCREGEAEGEGDGDMEMKSRGIKTDEEPGQRCKEPNSRIRCLQEVTPPEGEEGEARTDPRWNLRFPGQRLSATPAEHPQRGPDASGNLHSPATLNQAGPFSPPQASVEINNWCFSELWENSLMQDQQTRIVCDSSCSRYIKARTRSTEGQHGSSQMESSPRQAPTFLKPDQSQESKQSCVAPVTSVQKRSTAMAPSCCAKGKLTLASLSPDVETSSSANPGQVNYSVAVGIEDSAGLSWDDQAPNSILMDSLLPSQNFSYSDTTDYHAGKEEASSDGSSPHGNVVKTDLANKYQSFFFSGQIHGYGPAECLTSGVRPVQSCQDHTEDTSSSDDEGKLIIEL